MWNLFKYACLIGFIIVIGSIIVEHPYNIQKACLIFAKMKFTQNKNKYLHQKLQFFKVIFYVRKVKWKKQLN